MTRFSILFFFLWATHFAVAEDNLEPRANTTFLNGHNGSITSDTLQPGHCSIGYDSLGCGVTNRISMGSSPWLFRAYNMYSVVVRGLISEDQEGNRWAAQLSYFKTYETGFGAYQMESLWAIFVRTLNLAPHYRLHLNFQTNYYWNERMPFSLRRPYMTKTPFQFNFTTLHEVDLVHGWFIFGELGLWDFARTPLHVQAGASIGKVWRHVTFHVGFSMTAAVTGLMTSNRVDYQQYLRGTEENFNGNLDPDMVGRDYSLHPEVSLQYLF